MHILSHDFTAGVLFDIAFHAGLCGTTEPRGIFSQATPMEVVAAALEAEAAGGGRRGRPGQVRARSRTLVRVSHGMEHGPEHAQSA